MDSSINLPLIIYISESDMFVKSADMDSHSLLSRASVCERGSWNFEKKKVRNVTSG